MYKEAIQHVIAQQIAAGVNDTVSKQGLRFTETTKVLLQDSEILAHLSSTDNLFYASQVLAGQIKEHLFRIMPYVEMDTFTQEILVSVCKSLFVDVRRGYSINEIERKHFQRYKAWLELLYGKQKQSRRRTGAGAEPVYTEYSAGQQVSLLNLDLNELKTPLLDIGCGAHGHLVTYLRSQELPAFGLDRVADDSCSYFVRDYWWDFPFQKGTWGTITAHLSFSTHFLRAHLLRSPFSVRYAKLYLSILESLQLGGCFHYSPGLPFMEQWLPAERFEVKHKIVNDAVQATTITKKK
jgi:hypothetical protein